MIVSGRRRPLGAARGATLGDGEATLLPIYLDPMTKLFLVALMWCRPWLLDPAAATPLPRTPEIARAALQVTGAYHELERFDSDPAFRDLLSARVGRAHQGAPPQDHRPGPGQHGHPALRRGGGAVLIEHGIVTAADLGS